MSTIEELRGMTQEDLVRRVQELQEANDKLLQEKKELSDYYYNIHVKYENCKKALKALIE